VNRPDCMATTKLHGTTPLGLETPRTPPNRRSDRVEYPTRRDNYNIQQIRK